MRRVLAVALVAASPAHAVAQATGDAAPDEASAWEAALSMYLFIAPEEAYPMPTISADGDLLHLEARYNYEDLETGSVWMGLNLRIEETVSITITPIFAMVFGLTSGPAVGYRASLEWKWLSFYTEGELVFSEEPFFYSWSELSFWPAEFVTLGVAVQRTQVYETERDVQVGGLVGVYIEPVMTRFIFFDPDSDSRSFVLAVDVDLL